LIGRRGLTAGMGVAALLGRTTRAAGQGASPDWPALDSALARLAATTEGRLGVAVLDTASGRAAGLRAAERFPMCSTFKLLAAAAVLARVDSGTERLDRRIAYSHADLVPYSPITELYAGAGGTTLDEICGAMTSMSDNTAGNLALRAVGGPEGLTGWLRGTGDAETRLDRWEPALNTAIPGDPRDTTTPRAMLGTIHRLALGEVLSPASRERLTGWMLGCRTGGAKLRAQLPPGWRVGDRTGGGAYNTNNDVGILWPPGRPPVLVAAFLTEGPDGQAARDLALALVGAAVAASL
jgi:beta-lactamase class A